MKIKITLAFICFFLVSCAGKPPLMEQQISQQYPIVNELKNQLDEGQLNELDILSPDFYGDAKKRYAESLKLARENNLKATSRANDGLAILSKATLKAQVSQDVLEEVLLARDKAVKSNASQVSPEAFETAEKKLMELTGLIEKGNIEKAKEGRSDAMRAYADIELASIKVNVVEQAKIALAQAKKAEIDDVAPKTMKLAEEDYQLALNTLDANRQDINKANLHAQRSIWNSGRAKEIAEVIKYFRQSDFEQEDQVLWYQEQIARIVSPIEKNVAFNTSNKLVVKDLSAKLMQLNQDKELVTQTLNQTKERESKTVQEKELALQAAREMSESEKRRNQAIAAKFSLVQSLFDSQEAEVYRQTDNVLIRAQGFAFKSGDSEIDAQNFAILNKIIKAVEQFPNSKVIVSGHTDNRGSDEINLTLSIARANNVAKFLTEVGRIDQSRTKAMGFGKQKPVAENETPEGRAANRRVEVLIVNE